MSEIKKEEKTNNEAKGTQAEPSTPSSTQPLEMQNPQREAFGSDSVPTATVADKTETPKADDVGRETVVQEKTHEQHEQEEVKSEAEAPVEEGMQKQVVSFVVGLIIGALLVSVLI